LNLKNVEAELIGKGDAAVEEKWASATKIEAAVSLTKFYKGDIAQIQFFVLWGLKFVASKCKKNASGNYEIEFASPLPVRVGETVQLFLAEAMPRIIGSGKVVKLLS
ncbi:MAG: hypothetical protein NTV88_02935, partial [Candidatus Micrarchaeota archaeon]|nr:hypothetical protein [Candidatus Micrarchaeota archaeon]